MKILLPILAFLLCGGVFLAVCKLTFSLTGRAEDSKSVATALFTLNTSIVVGYLHLWYLPNRRASKQSARLILAVFLVFFVLVFSVVGWFCVTRFTIRVEVVAIALAISSVCGGLIGWDIQKRHVRNRGTE